MDRNGKLFGKISIFDVIVAVLIITVCTGVFYKSRSEKTNVEGGQKTIHYTVRIPNVRWFTLQYYQEGLRCFDTKTGEEIGKIVGVRSEPYTDHYLDMQGNVVLAEVPETIKIEVDIETPGLETDKGYFARGAYELKAGSEVYLTTKYVDVMGFMENVEAKAE